MSFYHNIMYIAYHFWFQVCIYLCTKHNSHHYGIFYCVKYVKLTTVSQSRQISIYVLQSITFNCYDQGQRQISDSKCDIWTVCVPYIAFIHAYMMLVLLPVFVKEQQSSRPPINFIVQIFLSIESIFFSSNSLFIVLTLHWNVFCSC